MEGEQTRDLCLCVKVMQEVCKRQCWLPDDRRGCRSAWGQLEADGGSNTRQMHSMRERRKRADEKCYNSKGKRN